MEESQEHIEAATRLKYSGIDDRVKATVFDSLFMIVMIYLCSEILGSFEQVATWVRVSLFFAIFVFYEPFFVSQFGGTMGHARFNLKVRSENHPKQKINFLAACIRFLIKYGLGWLSLITMGFSEKKMAIHHGIVGSVVLIEADSDE